MDSPAQQLASELEISCEDHLATLQFALQSPIFLAAKAIADTKVEATRYKRIAKLCLIHLKEIETGSTPTYPELNSILEKIAWDLYSEIFDTRL